MTSQNVHEKLSALSERKEEFKVVFSGRKIKRLNGLYKPFPREIVINERNFENEDGQINETALMYTALHELAHHIQMTEYGQKGARCHTKLFHSILDDLADKAEAAGIYRPVLDEELSALASAAKKISCEIAMLQRELGKVIANIEEKCHESGVRFDDVIKRKAHISLETAKKVHKMSQINFPADTVADVQEAITCERDEAKRTVMARAAQAGKSVAQVKCASSSSSTSKKSENETDNLLREKERLERTIATLQKRLKDIMRKLNNDSGLSPPCAAERI